MKIQEHLSLEEINTDVLGTYKAIGVDSVAVMHGYCRPSTISSDSLNSYPVRPMQCFFARDV